LVAQGAFDWRRVPAELLTNGTEYWILGDGNHRVEAAKRLGLKTVPAEIWVHDDLGDLEEQIDQMDEAKQPAFKSDELWTFWAIVDSGERTEEFYNSPAGDEEWKYAQEENGETDRKEWAKTESEFWMNAGYPSHFFSSLVKLKPSEWLIHFTDADPDDIVASGFHGRRPDILGLTVAWKEGTNEGDLAMAFPSGRVSHGSHGFGKYGDNAVIFQAREAVSAYHYSDEETQVVFDVHGVKNAWPIHDEGGMLVVHDPKTGERVLEVDRNQDGVNQIVAFVSMAKPGKTKPIDDVE
jgi:hypothetical protein